LIDEGALIDEEAPMPVEETAPMPIDEKAPGLVDEENAPEPLIDAVAPVIDPGIIEVGTLNGSQAAAVEVPPAEPFGMAQDVCVWRVALDVTPEVAWA
jgi:hypothetical protein